MKDLYDAAIDGDELSEKQYYFIGEVGIDDLFGNYEMIGRQFVDLVRYLEGKNDLPGGVDAIYRSLQNTISSMAEFYEDQ